MSVAIVMGSDSDLPVMRQAADALDELGIAWDMRVLSAHRTPDDTIAYARAAAGRGVQVIVAGAGGSAHLPGVIAAVTRLPVIGVPIALSKLDGLDSLLSIVQMPKGIPVATVAIDGARNAGLLAARMIGIADERVAGELERFAERVAAEVREKDAKLQARLAAGG
ncbi:MAG: 5-(carboxyamino)imidazole ribonucleotide mutase [Acidimicrobiales bacterium]